MKLIFMGTPDFAVPFLETLKQSRHEIALVVTQPDRPKGRGRQLAAPPVKEKALELGLPVAQPAALKTPEFHDLIKAQAADLMVVVAYRILPYTLFPLTRFGAVNVHGSLLPKYRGAAPIQWAVANGDAETGVTVFQLDKQIDHGGILAQARTPIGPEETSEDLFLRLRELGKMVLMRVLDDLEAGLARPMEQDHGQSSPAPKLKKEDGKIDWTKSAQFIHDRIRGFNPYPIGYTTVVPSVSVDAPGASGLAGRVLRIYASRVEPAAGVSEPGHMHVTPDRHPVIGTGAGRLKLMELQWEGKPRMSGPDFINGLQPKEREGLRFG